MSGVWAIDKQKELDSLSRRIWACLNWAFLRHVLVDSPARDVAIGVMEAYELRVEAESFYDGILPRLDDKLALVKWFFDWFPQLPRNRVAIEYLSSITGAVLSPIPN